MIDLIRSEWIKFRSVRSTVVTLLLAGGLVVLIAIISGVTINDDTTTRCEPTSSATATTTSVAVTAPDGSTIDTGYCGDGSAPVEVLSVNHLSSITAGVTLASVLFGVLGVQVIGQEYRFNTIRPTFTAAPHRFRVLLAKLIVVTAACAVVSLIMVAVCAAIGSVMIDRFVIDGVDHRLFWAIPLFSALWAMAGLGVGAIVRQPIAAILILLGESLVAEGLLGNLVHRSLPWLPFNNGIQMTARITDTDSGLRPLLEGGIYFAVVCAALFAIGTILVDRRDA